jgi:hypothetical protein
MCVALTSEYPFGFGERGEKNFAFCQWCGGREGGEREREITGLLKVIHLISLTKPTYAKIPNSVYCSK